MKFSHGHFGKLLSAEAVCMCVCVSVCVWTHMENIYKHFHCLLSWGIIHGRGQQPIVIPSRSLPLSASLSRSLSLSLFLCVAYATHTSQSKHHKCTQNIYK